MVRGLTTTVGSLCPQTNYVTFDAATQSKPGRPTHYPCLRSVNTGREHDCHFKPGNGPWTREHGPWTRVVCTGLWTPALEKRHSRAILFLTRLVLNTHYPFSRVPVFTGVRNVNREYGPWTLVVSCTCRVVSCQYLPVWHCTTMTALHQGTPSQMTSLEDPPPWLKPWLRPAYCFASVIVWT